MPLSPRLAARGRKVAPGVCLGAGSAACVLLLAWSGWLDKAELWAYDWRVRRAALTSSVHADIVLVEITDASIRDLAPVAGRWPWPRVLHSMLIDYLRRGSPKVVAIDVSFLEPEREGTFRFLDEDWTTAASDRALADAVRKSGNVILLADAVNPGIAGGESPAADWKPSNYALGPAIEERPVITLPYEPLASAAAGFGHNFLTMDPDGPARRIVPFVRQGGRFMPSLGVAAALLAGGYTPERVALDGRYIRLPDRQIPLVPVRVPDAGDASKRHWQQTMMINFRAAVHREGVRPYMTYEARHLLVSEGQILAGEAPTLDPAVFKDKIVFVGLRASGLVDVFPTPFGEGSMPGIQIHASVADSILSGRFIAPAAETTRVAAVVAGAIAIGLMSAMLPFWAAAIGSLALAAGWTWTAQVGFSRGTWLNLAQPVAAAGVALFAGTAYRYFVEGREKRKVKRLFGRYVSRDVYAQLLANPALAELGGRRRAMTVLFSDIRGFTAVTEKGNPEDLVAQLNEYFSRMVDVVFRHGGTVDKFVGDMVMALFGAPVDDPEHAEHAVAAAVAMVRELGDLNRTWALEGRAPLDIGIGINSGEMIAGNIGSSSIMSYTVIGDNVNLGSRLESLNKEYGTRIIISDATRAAIRGSYEIRPLGGVVVKGKTRRVDIYEVCVPSPMQAQATAAPAIEEKIS